jgi:hypothetical protein
MSLKSPPPSPYNLVSSALVEAAKAPPALTIPAHVGEETLVPPTMYHGVAGVLKLS